MKVPLSKISHALQYLNMLLWLMLNGSVVMLLHGNILIPLVLAFFLMQFLAKRKRRIYLNNIALALAFLAIYIMSYCIYVNQCWSKNQYYVNMLLLLCAALFAQLFTLSDFKKTYINTMVVVAICSLAMHFGAVLFGIDRLATRVDNIIPFGLHNYWAFSVGRNSGMFWEPGGFQIFLNLALLFSFYDEQKNEAAWSRVKRIVLIVTILTTVSTVGYAILVLILAFYMWKKLKTIRNRHVVVLAWIGYLSAVAVLFVALMNSTAVQDKLFTDNGSATMRQNDFIGSIELLKEIPWYGVGLNTHLKDQLLRSKEIGLNSIGLFASAINYGIFYMVLYISIIYSRVQTFMPKGKLPFLVIIMMISFTQSVFEFPVMFLFLFRFVGENGQRKLRAHA